MHSRGAHLLSLAVLLATTAYAQTVTADLPFPTAPSIEATPLPENRGAAALYESLKRLDTTASLMMIVAHPDDEDGGMLTYESRALGVRTALFTLTRGEGGQNAMSAADYDALGLIRTNELLRADEYYGVDRQYWGTVADYGFSKTMDEALSQWGHDRVLYDAVRAVRTYRPMVVCSVFVGGVTDGHGHHQVAGMLAQEVFNAAGDPKMYPDQIAAGLQPWKPLKVYARVPGFSLSPKGMFDYATGKYAPVRFHDYVNDTDINGIPATNVTIEEGERDPLLGQTYMQIARRGLGEQRSQHEGPNVPLSADASSAYHRYGSRVPAQPVEENFFDGIDTSLPGLAKLAGPQGAFLQQPLSRIHEVVTQAILNYSPDHPERTAPLLADVYRRTAKLLDAVKTSNLDAEQKASVARELELKLQQANEALAQALGIEVTALVTPGGGPRGIELYAGARGALPSTPQQTPAQVTPGSEFRVRVHIRAPKVVSLTRVALETPHNERWTVERESAPGLDDPHSTSGDAVFHVTVAQDAAPTAPYFSRPSTEQPYYDIAEPAYRNLSFAPYPVTGVATFDYNGVPIRLAQAVQTMHTELGAGAVYAPLVVTPELSVSLAQPWIIVPRGAQHDLTVPAHLHGTRDATGSLQLELPQGWQSTPATADFHLHAGEDAVFSFQVHAPALEAASYPITAVAVSGNYRFAVGYETAGYGALIPYNLYRPARTNVRGVDVTVAGDRRIGYVMGTGDKLPSAIEQLGQHVDLLSSADLLSGDLSRYQTIVLGIRAYAARPELPLANARLLAWVHAGGTLVVMYQGTEFDHGYAPYELHLNSIGIPERVVDEKAPVAILDPKDPLLTTPNRITEADFDGWAEERGHSFMSTWAPDFAAPTETHDPGQDPQRGGLLHASFGKGEYIYVAFALYRQTPEGVPGAYRLLANLLSAGSH
ncbi:MAG TPA: PIG-L family deacetylase [Acidobacteriaceae bacterium]|nr:PIG-L family deacetylase [Acidobacteriaceae bacterium]